MNKILRIYVHIPFCESKCHYCDFASFVCDEKTKERYFKALLDEISSCKFKGSQISSVYIGGGTPSSVDEKYIERVLRGIKQNFVVDKDAEITIECNPASNSLEKLKKYRKMGINRVSFGVQSLNNNTLKFLNRRHNKKEAKNAIFDAKKAGFENISADLIIGVDNGRALLNSAKRLISYGITHLSAYMLQIEEGTPLFEMVKSEKVRKRLKLEDECVKIYDKFALFLQKNGFERYEISNFCKKGYESRHNLGYWTLDEYIGFGLAAHSYVDGKRIANPCDFEQYYAGKRQVESLTNDQKIEEMIMLGLRCCEGFSLSAVKKLGYDIKSNKNFKFLLEKGCLKQNGDRITLNPDYYGVCNSIIVKLLP